MGSAKIEEMLGATMFSVVGEKGGATLVFKATDGRTFTFYHEQECCESVEIEDICGDLSDLIGSPITLAEESSNSDDPKQSEYDESWTWTFYRFGTSKGIVTVRWYGCSSGYYGEEVDMKIDDGIVESA